MRQFVLPDGLTGQDEIRLTGDEWRYLIKVLRLKTEAEIPAVDRAGRRYMLTIIEEGEDYLRAGCRALTDEAPVGPDLILIQCLPKGKKLEMIVRQAVEAGVSMIIPVESENTVPVIKEERSDRKQLRLQKIAAEAAQQSGNRGIPDILPPCLIRDLPSILEQREIRGMKLFFHQDRLAKGSLHRYLNDCPASVSVLIGPEGGISPAETDFLLASGFYPVYLGQNVLRTETAAIYALGAVKTILLEKDEWIIDIPK
ncbi:MAG: 16S rRNA (uracil(1498)-N(3))-methyltransferase [Spirochaetales bacterium]|nr:16S rRNA (uracil(1498)-N(3))-methyltransferase [Spirochaetales bacterium]